MLLRLRKEIGECYRRAAEAREKASAATDPAIRENYLVSEQSWLLLANSYLLSDHTTAFTGVDRGGAKRRKRSDR